MTDAMRDAVRANCINKRNCEWPDCPCAFGPAFVQNVIEALRPHTAAAVAEAVKAENEACALVLVGWIKHFGAENPQYVPARNWAMSAMEDCIENIRSRTQEST